MGTHHQLVDAHHQEDGPPRGKVQLIAVNSLVEVLFTKTTICDSLGEYQADQPQIKVFAEGQKVLETELGIVD